MVSDGCSHHMVDAEHVLGDGGGEGGGHDGSRRGREEGPGGRGREQEGPGGRGREQGPGGRAQLACPWRRGTRRVTSLERTNDQRTIKITFKYYGEKYNFLRWQTLNPH